MNAYTEAEVQRLLAEHPETAEQGITVVQRDRALVLCGEVESEHRRDEILRLVTEHLPGIAVTSDIAITRTHPPAQAEDLP